MEAKRRTRRANALVIVLGILFVVSAVVVSFARLTTAEMTASDNFTEKVQARLSSLAGTQQALAELRNDFRDRLFCGLEEFALLPEEKTAKPADWCYRAKGEIGEEDHIGDGISLSEMQNLADDYSHPSYARSQPFFGKKVSGTLGDDRAFTLKVFDTNSQLDLNSQVIPKDDDGEPIATPAIPLAIVIDHLSQAIASRSPYRKAFPGDDKGPFFSRKQNKFLGADIVAKREQLGGFVNKLQLLQVPGIVPAKLRYAWDYITVYSPKRSVVSRNEKFANEVEPYRTDNRAPVNINTASWPVLVAVFWGISCIDPRDPGRIIEIGEKEAKRLADRICRDRLGSPFISWEGFKSYLLANKSVFQGSALEQEEKAHLVYANCDPNVSLRRLNPDAPLWQPINKTDLTFYTTELCFYPHGVFEITSLGQRFSAQGNIAAEAQMCTVARAFSLMHKTTQVDFQSGQVVAAPDNLGAGYAEKYQLNATSHTNNLMMQPPHQESAFFGHVQPVISDYQYGVEELDVPVAEGGDLMFKANFNKTLDADVAMGKKALKTAEQDEFLFAQALVPEARQVPTNPDYEEDLSFANKSRNFSAAPNINDTSTSFLYGDVLPDGVAFWEDTTHPTKASNALCYQANGNLPNASIPGEEDGTLMLWFKLNENQDIKYRTIFFATSVIDPPSSGLERGIQMEVKMKYNPGTGTLDILAQRRFYIAAPKSFNGDFSSNITTCPFPLVSTLVEATYSADESHGVKAHEWYHLAIRWRNGTDMAFSDTNADAVLLSGNFYALDDNGRLQKTPTGKTIALLKSESAKIKTKAVPTFSCTPPDVSPLESGELGTEKGRVYIGAMVRNGQLESMAMTIDDVRFVRDAQAIDDAVPSRFPEMEEFVDSKGVITGVISKFNGAFINKPENSVVLGGLDWTIRSASGLLNGIPFLRQGNQSIGLLPKRPSLKRASLDEDELFERLVTPISHWKPQRQPKLPLLIDNEDLDSSARQLGVMNEVWEVLYEMLLPPRVQNRISLQEFIDNFGIALIVVWNANRGSLPPLQDFVNDDFDVSEGEESGLRLLREELTSFAERLQRSSFSLSRQTREARRLEERFDREEDEAEDKAEELEKRSRRLRNRLRTRSLARKLRREAREQKRKAEIFDEREDQAEDQQEFLTKSAEDVESEVEKLLQNSENGEGEITGRRLRRLVRGTLQPLFFNIFFFNRRFSLQNLIDRVNRNLGTISSDFGIDTLGLSQLSDLSGGAFTVPLPKLGIDLQGIDRDANIVVDDTGLVEVENPGNNLARAAEEEIVVLPKLSNFDYQLRFEVEKEAKTEKLVPQFLAPIIDDLTLLYQNRIEYLDQFELLLD